MSSNENFWLASAAAAPVIALAAMVALPETSALVEKVPGRRERQAISIVFFGVNVIQLFYLFFQLVRVATIVNLLAQAALLAVSLWSLAYEQDVMPPWVAIVLAVCGILLLAWSSTVTAGLRRLLEKEPDSVSSSGNEKSLP